jgi:RHS repeat-associated protein
VTRPDAVRKISGGTPPVEQYRYDCNGSITEVIENPGAGQVQWLYKLNTLNRVQTVQRNNDPVSTNAYDITGQRVIRQDPDGTRTLYLGAIEISHTTAGGLSVVKQYPSLQRTPTGVTFTASDHQGSLAATLSNTSTTSYLRYKPYGDQRGPGTAPNQRAFLNQVKDTPQSLTYLNQRSVDTQTGTFTTVDPLTVTTRDPYIYANANPISLSDPSGLCSSERACETAIRQCENSGGVWNRKSGTCGSGGSAPAPGSGGPGSNGSGGASPPPSPSAPPFTAAELTAMQCIYNPSCGATDLVAAIKAAPSDLRDLIVGVVDVAQYGDVSLYDGNWSSQDVEAAANAENLIAMGADPATAALIASVAGRLIGHGDQWETLDAKEQSWGRGLRLESVTFFGQRRTSISRCLPLATRT